MNERSLTPNITVTIGHHTRIYFAFVTTAPVDLDSPATVTLHAATFSDVVSLAAEPITIDHSRARVPARWCSSTRWSLRGSEPSTAVNSIRSWRRIPGSSASTRCSTGSGNGFRPRHPARSLHDSHTHVRVNRSPWRRASQGSIMVVKIVPNDKANPPGKLADAELHFTDGVLDGLKLIGFAVWERRSGSGRNVTFPARQYSVNGERRSFALLRPIAELRR
jgi:hypothetical protein